MCSDGRTEVEGLSLRPNPTSSFLFSLAGVQMKDPLQDDGAPLWQLSRPHIWPAAVAIPPPDCAALVVSSFQGLSQGLQMCFS